MSGLATFFIDFFNLCQLVLSVIGGIIIVWGGFLAIRKMIMLTFCKKAEGDTCKEMGAVWHILEGYVMSALGFIIAAAVLMIVSGGGLMAAAYFGALVLIRAFMSYFLCMKREDCKTKK